MTKFLWKESFGIGIDAIDSQHQILINYLNECMEKSGCAMDNVSYAVLLDELKTYADTHFKAEEDLMRSVDYPGLEGQQKQHRLFEEYVEQLQRAVTRRENLTVVTLSSFLKDWFIEHIMADDKRIGVHVLQ